jgi:ATP-dependent Clp protease adaptor protein ClpS
VVARLASTRAAQTPGQHRAILEPMAGEPDLPGGGKPPGDPPEPAIPDEKREGGVATAIRPKTRRPDRYKVLLHNDDYTPMEFVVTVLEKVFAKGPSAATQIMLAIHRSGLGVAGVFVLEVAETKVSAVHRMAEDRGYPLRAGIEKE